MKNENIYCLKSPDPIVENKRNTSGVEAKLQSPVLFFDNLPDLIRPKDLANILSISVSTVYDWKYRSSSNHVPKNLFMKINRLLYIRTGVLKNWIRLQPHFHKVE